MALMPFGSPPDKWRTDTVLGKRHISPKTETDVLYIGERDAATALETSFTGSTAFFVGNSLGGTNYFINVAHGTSFIPFGGLFATGRAEGTFASPTNVSDGSWIGGLVGIAYQGGAWSDGGPFALPGVMMSQLDHSGTDFGTRLYIGSALYEAITVDMPITGTPQTVVYINRPNHDIDTSIGWDGGTALFVEGSSGQIQVADGSATAPELSFISDTNTGVYSPGADLLGLAAGGAESIAVGTGGLTTPYIDVMRTDRTLSANSVLIGYDSTTTLDFANAVMPLGFNYATTAIFNQNGYGFGSGVGFWMHPLIQNSSGSTRTIGPYVSNLSQPNYQANGGSLTVGFDIQYSAQPTYNRINSGTTTVTGAAMFYSPGATIGAGATVTTFTDFYAADASNSGTFTNHVGLNIGSLTAATNNTAIAIGTATTGNWGIYQSTTTDNYFAGDIQIADGSAASPSLTFGSDTDTGIHRVGANQMSFDTNGLARLQISATTTVVNPSNLGTGDFQVHGDTLNNLIFTDASADALGFFNATPIARPTTSYGAATFTANTSGIANDTATFDGYTIGQVIKVLRDIGILT